MPEFYVIDGTPEPMTPANAVRKRVREKRPRDWPSCPHCGGRETIAASIGNVRNKLCSLCFMQGRRVVVG